MTLHIGHWKVTFFHLWPKTIGQKMSVTNGSLRPFLGIGHRQLWPKQKVTNSMTNCFGHYQSGQSTSDPTWLTWRGVADVTSPSQIQRGWADVAKLWPNEMVVNQNQPSPVQCSKWAWPNNSAHLIYFFRRKFGSNMGRAQLFGLLIFGPWPFCPQFRTCFYFVFLDTQCSLSFGP